MAALLRVGLLAVLLGSTSADAADNLWGGQAANRHQLYIDLGYPNSTVGARLRVADPLAVIVEAKLTYALGANTGRILVSPAAGLRAQVFQKDKLYGAVHLLVPIHVPINTNSQFGVGIGHLAFQMSYAATMSFDLDFGVRVEPDLWLGDTSNVWVGAPAFVGVESDMGPVQLGGKIEAGPLAIPGVGVVSVARIVVGLGFQL